MMNQYMVPIKVWYKDGVRIENCTISAPTIGKALDMALDDEGGTWEYKRAKKEVLAVIKVV